MSAAQPNLVFVGIEISDYERNANMLQIVMKSGSSKFNKYIHPTKPISKEMTKVNHLTVRNMRLYRDKVWKRSQPLQEVLLHLLDYLRKFEGPCTLIGHKYSHADSYRLIGAIKKYSLENEFASVIDGFTSAYRMFAEKFPEKDPKELTIHRLATEIGLPSTHAFRDGRSVKHNTALLEKVTLQHFDADELRAKRSFPRELAKYENSQEAWSSATRPRNTEAGSRTRDEEPTTIPETTDNPRTEISQKSRSDKHDMKESRKLCKVGSVSVRTRTRKVINYDGMY